MDFARGVQRNVVRVLVDDAVHRDRHERERLAQRREALLDDLEQFVDLLQSAP